MGDRSDLTAQGDALQQLIAAMQACESAKVPRREILEIVRAHLPEDDDVSIEGSLIEHLGDRDASRIIQIVYEALLSGATFSFVDGRRTRENLLELSGGMGEVSFTRDGGRRRVMITKPPS